jgi:hypothetical protein
VAAEALSGVVIGGEETSVPSTTRPLSRKENGLSKLAQSRGLLRIDSEIVSDGVVYRERGVLTSHETKIPFEHIADELVRSFHVPRLYLFISLFFALAFGYRLIRFTSTNQVSLLSLLWSGILFAAPTLGTWMHSPTYVGYLSSRGGLLFFDKRGTQDPNPYLAEIQKAKAAYLRRRYSDSEEAPSGHDHEPNDPFVH